MLLHEESHLSKLELVQLWKVKCIDEHGLSYAAITKLQSFSDLKQCKFISVIYYMSSAS